VYARPVSASWAVRDQLQLGLPPVLRLPIHKGGGPVTPVKVLLVLALAGLLAGCSGGASVRQWWSAHGQSLMQSLNQDVGQLHSDSQYDPAVLPADGRQLMSDVGAAQANLPPKDESDYRAYLSALTYFAQADESGDGDGPLTGEALQNGQRANQALTGFGNMLACYDIALDGGMGSCSTPGSGESVAAPSQSPSSADGSADPSSPGVSANPSSADTSADEEQAQSNLQAVQAISFSADLANLNADARTSADDGRKSQADYQAYMAACASTGESSPEGGSMQLAFNNDETKMFGPVGQTPISDDSRATNDTTKLQQDINTAGSHVTALKNEVATLQSEGADVPSGAQAAITATQNAVSQAVGTANADIDQLNQTDNNVLKLQGSPACPIGGSYSSGAGIAHVTSG
jgi:hypothetical protein